MYTRKSFMWKRLDNTKPQHQPVDKSCLVEMPSSEIRRKTLVQNVLSRSISNVSKPIHAQTLAEAFPYATPQMLDTLAEQTKTLVSHYANVSNIFLLYLFQYVSCP
ncbi:uncharacterized protein VP01_7101g1 [Puccinia sorghi]|uniref:Uncharacterized protein n=1 Tax=Puccinia sorghi TaxID=27349 RepID=A0A0L6UDN0_9BASI|nr:uncharacterized protein VP01_7101g1 [Puccinia sorghi]